jgi:AtzH-like
VLAGDNMPRASTSEPGISALTCIQARLRALLDAERNTVPNKLGRQMRKRVRKPDGWRVVAAHVSLLDA